MDCDAVTKALDRSHELVTDRFNSSETLQSTITLAYYSATDYYYKSLELHRVGENL